MSDQIDMFDTEVLDKGIEKVFKLDWFPKELPRRLAPNDSIMDYMKAIGPGKILIEIGDIIDPQNAPPELLFHDHFMVVDGNKRILAARKIGWDKLRGRVSKMYIAQAIMLRGVLNNARSENEMTDIENVNYFLNTFPSTATPSTIAYYTALPLGKVKQIMKMANLNPLLHQAVVHGVITEDTLAKIANTPGGEQFALERMEERMQTDFQVDDTGQWMSRKTGKALKNPPILVTPDDLKGISKVSRANAISGLNLNLNLNATPKVQGYMVIDPTQVFANVDEAKAYRLQVGGGVVVLVREV